MAQALAQLEEVACMQSMFPEPDEMSMEPALQRAYDRFLTGDADVVADPDSPWRYTIHLSVRRRMEMRYEPTMTCSGSVVRLKWTEVRVLRSDPATGRHVSQRVPRSASAL